MIQRFPVTFLTVNEQILFQYEPILLLTKVHTILSFPYFWWMFFFYFRIPYRISHYISLLCFLRLLLTVTVFQTFHALTTLRVWRNNGLVFPRTSLRICLIFFSWVDYVYSLGRRPQRLSVILIVYLKGIDYQHDILLLILTLITQCLSGLSTVKLLFSSFSDFTLWNEVPRCNSLKGCVWGRCRRGWGGVREWGGRYVPPRGHSIYLSTYIIWNSFSEEI